MTFIKRKRNLQYSVQTHKDG